MKTPVQIAKDKIQDLCRAIVIKRDGGCFLRDYPEAGNCGGYRKDGGLILQFDHLNSRTYSISYGDSRLGVCICRNHHIFWKKQHPDLYTRLSRKHIGEKNSELLDRVTADRRPHHMLLWDWQKVILQLEQELKTYS